MALSVTPAAPVARGIGRMSPIRALVAMTRPSQVGLIWIIFAAGALLGLSRPGAELDAWSLAVVAALVTGAAIAAHLVNEAVDEATDRLTVRTRYSGGSGALEASGLSPAFPFRLGLGLAMAVAAGAGIAWLALPVQTAGLALVMIGLLAAVAYSLPPLSVMRRGWGEPLNATLGGLILPLAGVAAVAGSVGPADVLAFLPLTLVVMASVMATAWPDRLADGATGKRTMQVRLQPATLRRIHGACLLGFVATTVLAAAADAAPAAIAGLLVVPALVVGTLSYTRHPSPLPSVWAMVGLALVLAVGHGLVALGRPVA